jgi:hypothetical protein
MSAVRFACGVAPHMRKQGGGRIINMHLRRRWRCD